MKNVVLFFNVIISVVVLVLILIQGKGAGLGSAWGGSGEMFQTRRGIEKLTLQLTVLFTALFLITAVISLFLK